jgi:E3 ubiquitin-protein ligase KEG
MLSRGGGGGGVKRCKHQVAVKRVPLAAGDGLEVVQEEVERLRRASTWCRNVCTFHGAVRVGGHLCFVMDRYVGSVQAEMRQNGGRLTLEQILRCDIASKRQYLVISSSYSFCCCLTNNHCKHISQ